jgi:HemY protein
MRLLIIALLVLVGASVLTALALEKPGFVLIAYDKTSIEIALFDFVLLLIALFVALYLLLRFLVRLVVLPAQLRKSYQMHQLEKAQRLFYKGLLELAEGRWTRAERLLLRSVWHHDTPLMGYLGAARAAQMQAAYERRDEYLKRAIESDRSAGVAVGLVQAELQLSSQQKEQALATLQHLHEVAPKHGYVLYMLARIYRSLAEWERLLNILPVLRKSKAIPIEQIDEVEGQAVVELMGQAGKQGDSEAVQKLWKRLPRRLKQKPRLAESHIRALEVLGQHEQAASELRKFLNTEWDQGLICLLGALTLKEPLQVLGHAESWLKEHGDDPDLLLTLGRLCLQAELWGKARLYLENSLSAKPQVLAYRLLGDLLERTGERAQAQACYQLGLRFADEGKAQPLRLPPPNPVMKEEGERALPEVPHDAISA